ncbi:tRNA-splicing endonuclease positive effector protein, putative [Eimeria necatrix]|uniref:tRNA-splicing endonuclease positive effector protein, putative n=1 Tax=Eimeria necatrix TaxID=51315 RepID=U6MPX7_9EIME|nr:tRNA-splicing endonuclease positive effector protein, putative [Eimeria necatrix]CDJ66282.1 tRNA-splicing endonuclease positive effector protein, putative [Eimeria necatrix]
MVSLKNRGGGQWGSSSNGSSRSSSRPREKCSEEEIRRAELLGSAWLQRYRQIEGTSLLPSVEPLDELLLGLDFFEDLREEDVRALPADPSRGGHAEEKDQGEDEEGSNVGNEENDTSAEASNPCGEPKQTDHSTDESHNRTQHLRAIPTVIPNENVYVGFFFPLFLQEAKQALARAIKVDLGPPEDFIQQSGEPRGSLLSLHLSRTGSAAAASESVCRYCHGDLVLMYIPAAAADTNEAKAAQQKDSSKEATQDASAKDNATADSGKADETDEAQVQPTCKPLKARDLDCHVLAVVSQGQHESITVKLLTPLGPAYSGRTVHGVEGSSDSAEVYNPATGRPYGFLLPRERQRLVKLVKALNAQFTRWTVQRIMSLTTLYREFQGLMSLPDLLLKDSLFRLAPTGPSSQRESGKNKLLGPLNNPLLESNEDNSETLQGDEEEGEAAAPPVAMASSDAPPATSDVPGTLSASPPSRKSEVSADTAEELADDKPQQNEKRLVIPKALRERLESLYNASQLAALEDSLKVEGVTLIQGPPGTGKTSTIVGVVSVILHAQLEGQQDHKSGLPSKERSTAEEKMQVQEVKAKGTTSSSLKRRPWLQPNYTAWMDLDEITLEDLDSRMLLQPAAMPTEPPIILTRERHELQPVYVYMYSRILVCAPSNAAIDEIVKRLTADPESGGGIFDGNGQRFSPSVVRVGPNVHPDLLPHSLQYKALQRLKSRGATNFAALSAAKADVLRDSVIVCATISVCGSNDLTSLADCFDTVVVDEASQAVELATLIPLRLGCRRLILVGDPKQLPATIFSRVAIQLRYDRSLFQRLEGAGQPTNMLSQQYRMHPAISRFASVSFYEGLLKDAPHLPNGLWTPFPFWHRLPILQPLVFFNLDSDHTEEHTSFVNYTEADFVRQLVDFLRRLFIASGHAKWEHRLAVISPYAQQVVLLRRTIKALLGVSEGKSCPVDVNTVDGFQGQEKDFIIFSAVRGIRSDREEAKKGTVGFLGDMRRLNVAVTRGRVNLWMVGNGCFLRRDKTWARLYAYAKDRHALISISRRNAQHSAILTRWVLKYCKTHHRDRKLLEEHAPKFLAELSESLKAMRERKQKRGGKEEEEPADELQTEGPISWEQPVDDPDAEEGAAVTGEMTTFHDVADEGCLDEVAVHMRDETLKTAVDAEAQQNPVQTESSANLAEANTAQD